MKRAKNVSSFLLKDGNCCYAASERNYSNYSNFFPNKKLNES